MYVSEVLGSGESGLFSFPKVAEKRKPKVNQKPPFDRYIEKGNNYEM